MKTLLFMLAAFLPLCGYGQFSLHFEPELGATHTFMRIQELSPADSFGVTPGFEPVSAPALYLEMGFGTHWALAFGYRYQIMRFATNSQEDWIHLYEGIASAPERREHSIPVYLRYTLPLGEKGIHELKLEAGASIQNRDRSYMCRLRYVNHPLQSNRWFVRRQSWNAPFYPVWDVYPEIGAHYSINLPKGIRLRAGLRYRQGIMDVYRQEMEFWSESVGALPQSYCQSAPPGLGEPDGHYIYRSRGSAFSMVMAISFRLAPSKLTREVDEYWGQFLKRG